MQKAALIQAAVEVEEIFQEICTDWNESRASDNASLINEVLIRASGATSLATLCAGLLTKLPPAAAAAGVFCGVVGPVSPELLDELCE